MKRPKRQMIERKLTIADAVSEAFGTLQGLGEEMREAFDNTPESLQQSGVGEARGEAADALENLSEPDVSEALGKLEFTFSEWPLKPRASRSDQRGQAVNVLDCVIQFLNELGDSDDDEGLVDLVAELENLKDEAEAVEFPGMYG